MSETSKEKGRKAETELLTALTKSHRTLSEKTPRLLTERPQVEANSLRHGLTGQNVFLAPVELRQYLIAGATFIAELQPIGISEVHAVQQIIDTHWRLNWAMALQTTIQTSTVILESHVLTTEHPHVDSDIIRNHAEAFAAQKQCGGDNTLEKLGRHETRLRRAIREMHADYIELRRRRYWDRRDKWTCETSEAWLWYNNLAVLATALVQARQELAANTVEEISSVDASGAPVSPAESKRSPETLFCKKSLRIIRPLSQTTLEILAQAKINHLLTHAEANLLPLLEAT